MTLDFATLDALRTHHPAWRLLRSDHAPLLASFLQRKFYKPGTDEAQFDLIPATAKACGWSKNT